MGYYEKLKSLDQKEINYAFLDACGNGELKKVKYLLSSPELDIRADVHSSHDYGLRIACTNNDVELINFLILDQNLEIRSFLEQWLNGLNGNNCKYEYTLNLIEKRELSKELDSTLEIKQTTTSKIKL